MDLSSVANNPKPTASFSARKILSVFQRVRLQFVRRTLGKPIEIGWAAMERLTWCLLVIA
jgi:hypothetical protein